MRYVGIAALAATFWLLVATARLVMFAPAPDRAAEVQTPAPARIDQARLPPRLPKGAGYECGLSGPGDPPSPPRQKPGSPISNLAIVQGFNAVRPQLADCYRRFQVPGIAMANVVIARNGRVSTADVTGKFAGTPTGACVEEAARTARFPPSDGLSTPYPFYLR